MQTTMGDAVALFDTLEADDLSFASVQGMQILKALLAEVQVQYASGLLYRTLQDTANEARQRGLLLNPGRDDAGRRTEHSARPGDTRNMLPSEHGWEQTKGILYRRLQVARNSAARTTNANVRSYVRAALQNSAGIDRSRSAPRANPRQGPHWNRDELPQAGAGPMDLAASTRARTFTLGPPSRGANRPRR